MPANILMMDDEPAAHQRFIRYLAKNGYDIDQVDGEPQAIGMAIEKSYSYIFARMSPLNQCNKEKFFHRLRTLHPESKILLVMEDGWNRQESETVRMADGTLLECALPRHLDDMLATL